MYVGDRPLLPWTLFLFCRRIVPFSDVHDVSFDVGNGIRIEANLALLEILRLNCFKITSWKFCNDDRSIYLL